MLVWPWVLAALLGALVAGALAAFFTVCRVVPCASLGRRVSTSRTRAPTVVSRTATMNACDLVVDTMLRPKFWSSINSARMNTLEAVVERANRDARWPARLYVPMPILNVSYRALLKALAKDARVHLVSNIGDETMLPRVHSALVADARIERIYVNNVPLTFTGHPKYRFIPIGYCQDEYARFNVRSQFLLEVRLQRLGPLAGRFVKNHPGVNVLDMRPRRPLRDKRAQVICAFSNTGSEWTVPTLRRDSRAWLAQQPFGAVLPFMEKRAYFAKHEDYAFELSPFGNGLDCFRHWECLLLHTIPIVFDSPVNAVFRDLPVLIVKDYREITPALLADTQAKFADYFETHDIRKELDVSRWLAD